MKFCNPVAISYCTVGTMNIFIIGNSGAGKSTLAQHLATHHDRIHLELDGFAWTEAVGDRRDTADAVAAIRAKLGGRSAVVEGCYGDLVAALMEPVDLLVWLDLPVAVCVANCEQRPFEPHKWPTAEEQRAFLPKALAFVREYPTRTDDLGKAAHHSLFRAHSGPKSRWETPPRWEEIKVSPP